MKNIRIGTCVPGRNFAQWAPKLVQAGFECVTVNYHMEMEPEELAALPEIVKRALDGTSATISALGFYCNALENPEHEKKLHAAIDAAGAIGAKIVSTFAGALEGQSVEAAMPRFRTVFGELASHAEAAGVKLAIENCPMGGTWQKNTCNIGFNPRAWDMMFDAVPSPALGLEWEPAHQMCQLIDPVANLRQYVGRVYHLHGKDASIHWDAIARAGILGAVNFVDSRFPGFGDTDWRTIFAILQENGYDGAISVEGYHDPYYSHDWEMTGQLHAMRYLKWCRGGDFTPNPW